MDTFPIVKRTYKIRKNSVFGVATNYSTYIVKHTLKNGKQVKCPVYVKWHSMIERCNSKKYHLKRPTYIGCYVCDEWLCFSNFLEWYKSQDNNDIGHFLDKDLKVLGNRIYSPDTCLLVPNKINTFINNYTKRRGVFKHGVSLDKRSNRFNSRCCDNGKDVHIGNFKTEELAFIAYKKYKMKLAIDLGNDYPHLKQYLINYVNSI